MVDFQHLKSQVLLAVYDNPLPYFAVSLVGLLVLISHTISFIRLLVQTFLLPGKSLKAFGARKGAWAVVTGATDGIGREFALQLSQGGFNVLLASRSQEKLKSLAADIESKYKVETKVHAIDFSKKDPASYNTLAQLISTIDVGVLVNNVGKSHDIPTYFEDTPEQEIDEILEINIHAALKVTRFVLPGMIAKKRGLILNLGSFAGAVPSPMLATYSGSKAFLLTWSQALGEELRSKGITVELLNTYFVVSAMSKIRRSTAMIPTPKAYVKSALARIGLPCGALGRPFTSTPYWSHAILDWIMGVIGRPGIFIRYTHRLHKDIRARALRKRARESKSD